MHRGYEHIDETLVNELDPCFAQVFDDFACQEGLMHKHYHLISILNKMQDSLFDSLLPFTATDPEAEESLWDDFELDEMFVRERFI